MKYIFTLIVSVFVISCSEGPTGPTGPTGDTGDPGSDSLSLATVTGTIYNYNYETTNSSWAALPLPNADSEPAVIFFGIANANSIYNVHDWEAIIYSNGTDGYDVNGIAGYYLLVYDPSKTLLTENYKIKYLK